MQDWKDSGTVVVLGGGIYASGIAGLSFLKKNRQALMEARGQSCDWTDRKYLTPLLEYLNK